MKRSNIARKGCLALLLLALVAAACKKGGSGSAPSQSLLTGSTWTFVKFEYQQKDGTWIPDPNAQYADRFTVLFNANSTFFELHQANGYNATGSWSLSSSPPQLTVTGGIDISGTYAVNQLTSSTLQITNTNYATAAYSAERLTFTH